MRSATIRAPWPFRSRRRTRRSIAVLASAKKVDNMLPAGSNWNGKNELLVSEQQFEQMLSDREPGSEPRARGTAGGSVRCVGAINAVPILLRAAHCLIKSDSGCKFAHGRV